VQDQELARPSVEGVIRFRHHSLGKAPFPHIAHHSDNLLPGTIVAALREHLAERVLVRPEEARHALIDHAGTDDAIGLIRRRSVVVLIELGKACVERQGQLDVGGRGYPSLEQSDTQGAEIFGRDLMPLHQLVVHLGCLPAQLDVIVAAPFERQVVAQGNRIHSAYAPRLFQQGLGKVIFPPVGFVRGLGQLDGRRPHAVASHADVQTAQACEVLQ
jgi:hypothetical protein